MDSKKILVAMSKQYNGNWDEIYKALRDKVEVDFTLGDGTENCVTVGEEEYPSELREMPKPPFLLYLRGDKNLLNAPKKMFILGDKEEKLSPYQKQWCAKMVKYTAENDGVIVTLQEDYLISLCQQYGCKCICSYDKLPDTVPQGLLAVSEMTSEMTGDPKGRRGLVGLGLGNRKMMVYAAFTGWAHAVNLALSAGAEIAVLPCDSEDIGAILEEGATAAVHPDFVWGL